MKAPLSWQDYQTLELVSPQQQKKQNGLGAKLNNLIQEALAHLAATSEPRVWTTQDSTGRTQWKAYDPMTRRSASCDSVEEMQVWLEERHYQYHLTAR